jgi:CysZ protein
LFAYLSGKTEEIITGKSYPFNLAQFVKDVFRGIGITVRNMFIETMFMVTGGIIGIFVPFLSPFIILTLFLINSYFMAFNFFDYVVERKGMNISNSTRYMRSNKFTLLGFGFAYNIVSIIPMLDWVLAPISAATGSVIADSELPENLRSDSLKYLKT